MNRVPNVPVEKLLLWEENPRIDVADNQLDAVNKVYNFSNRNQKTSKRQLMNLAQSIAEFGYQNDIEPILVVESNGNYIVQDANRRLSAIKILNNPDEYKDILDENDYKKILGLVKDYDDKIPTHLDVVSFKSEEEKELEEILSRKHDGPLDGVGSIPWSSEAKDRFTGRRTFANKLEIQFEEQFGQTLTDYIGGKSAKTSTERIFNSKPVKDFLIVSDENNASSEELDRVKRVADEVKSYADNNETFLSRLNVRTIENDIIQPLMESDQASAGTPKPTPKMLALTTFQRKLKEVTTNLDKHLGSRYNQQNWLLFEPEENWDLNVLLASLRANAILTGDSEERLLKAYLYAPSLRVIFEFSIRMLIKKNILNGFPNRNPSKDLDKNVKFVHDNMKSNNAFLRYLSVNHVIDDSYTTIKSILENTNFESEANESHMTSHKSAAFYDVDTLVRLFNDAVLFAVLSQQYAEFTQSQQPQTSGQN